MLAIKTNNIDVNKMYNFVFVLKYNEYLKKAIPGNILLITLKLSFRNINNEDRYIPIAEPISPVIKPWPIYINETV